MTSRGSRRRRTRTGAGFTLLEMIIVLIVLGLAVGIVVSRGPMRSRSLEARAVASEVAQTLRGARAKAIASNRPVRVVVDLAKHSIAVDGGHVQVVPADLGLSVVAVSEETLGKRLAGIRFAPDGSATGGRIEVWDGKRHIQVGVDWLTGRVTVVNVT